MGLILDKLKCWKHFLHFLHDMWDSNNVKQNRPITAKSGHTHCWLMGCTELKIMYDDDV